jgi:hypothetical protein
VTPADSIRSIDPILVVRAVTGDVDDKPLAAAIIAAVADDLHVLVGMASDGDIIDPAMLSRLEARCYMAADLVAQGGAQ